MDARDIYIGYFVPDGVTGDCSKVREHIETIEPRDLIVDRSYDSNKIVRNAESLGMKTVILLQRNRKSQRKYDKNIHAIRSLVKNSFLCLKC